jgi:hypothetical protein
MRHNQLAGPSIQLPLRTPRRQHRETFPATGCRSPYSSIDQTDLVVRRRFNLNVRAEYFNIFNHPMFGAQGSTNQTPYSGILLLNLALGGGGSVGGQSAQYALGGPRSPQFTIKLQF